MKEGWKQIELSEVCDFENGDRGKNYPSKQHQTNQGIPFINAGHMINGKIDYSEMNYISKERYDLLGNGKIKPDDILFCLRGSLGKCASVGPLNKGAIASSLVIIRPNKNLLPKFLLAYFQSNLCQNMIAKFENGAAQPNLSAGSLKKFILPLPPLDEQQHIVQKLDAAFAAIDQAIANTGKNLENVRELLLSFYNSVFSHNKTWDYLTLDETCIVERGSSPRPIKEYVTQKPDGVNWIKIGDTKNVDKYIFTTKEKITPKGAEKSRFVNIGDLILSNSMSFGKPYIMKTTGYIHDGWFVLRPYDFIDTEYFWHALSSPTVIEQINTLASGAIVKNISGDLVKKVILPIPPKVEQLKLSEQLDENINLIKQLEQNYQQKLTILQELKQSILQKAFQGEL